MSRVLMVLASLIAVAGCNTVEGVAEDVKQTSRAVRNAL